MIRMLKKIFTAAAIVFIFFVFVSTTYGAQILVRQEKVVYTLPYPGILPDNPLYFLKALRDRFLDITTRDYLKKAELYLLLSDKRVAMAQALVEAGKDSLAITTFSKAEKYFLKIPPLLATSKKQGVTASSDLIDRLKLSNAKHQMVAADLLKKLPQGRGEDLREILQINSQIRARLLKL